MDPNGIAGVPTERWVWLAPDWSTFVEDSADRAKRPPGATRVRVRTTLYNDGRRVTVVLNETGDAVSAEGAPTSDATARALATATDPDQQRIYNAAAAAARAAAPDTTSPASKRTAREEAEIAANAALPLEQDPRSETNAERAKRAEETYRRQDTTVVSTEYVGKGRDRKKVTTYQSGRKTTEDAATAATAQSVTYEADGTKVTTYDDGTTTREAPAPTRPSTASDAGKEVPGHPGWTTKTVTTTDSEGNKTATTVYIGPDGKEQPNPPAENQFPTEPAGAPAAALNYGMVTESLAKYRDFLNQQVQAGTLKSEDATKLMAARLAQAKLAMEEQQNVVSAQTGMFGQQVTQRGQSLTETQSRRAQAMGVYNGVLGAFLPMLKYMPKGGGQAMADLMMAAMSYGKAMATDWGGMREVPEIAYGPAAAEARRTGMPGGPSSVPSPEAAGSFLQQGQAADVEAANQAAQAQSRAAFGALGVGPASPAAPIVPPPPPVTGPVAAPGAPINPPLGEPGHDPTQPVGMAPPAQGTFMQAYNRPPSAPGRLGSLLDDGWMPNSLVAQAYQEVFGVPFGGGLG